MVKVIAEKCTGCGFCFEECPSGIFVPEPAPDGRRVAAVRHTDECTVCGHCVAICPSGAVAHDQLPSGVFEDGQAITITPEAMRNFLLSRRSSRAFKEKPVPREAIEQLIEAGTHAGTASNAQTEGFIVIQDRRLISDLEELAMEILWGKLKILGSRIGRSLARFKYGKETVKQSVLYYERFKARRESGETEGLVFRGAPVVIAAHGAKNNFSARENCAIAVRNMEMLAKSLGLGTCWAGFLLVAAGMTDKVARRLGLPADRNIYSAIMLGYPKREYKKMIPRKQRDVRWFEEKRDSI